MKKIFLILMLCFSVQFVFAQTQEEIDKMKQKQRQMKKIENDNERNKILKGMQDQLKMVTDAMKDQKGNNATSGLYSSDPGNVGSMLFSPPPCWPGHILVHFPTRFV